MLTKRFDKLREQMEKDNLLSKIDLKDLALKYYYDAKDDIQKFSKIKSNPQLKNKSTTKSNLANESSQNSKVVRVVSSNRQIKSQKEAVKSKLIKFSIKKKVFSYSPPSKPLRI